MIFAREPLTHALIDEMLPLLRAHWREIATYQDIPLKIDATGYVDAEDAGILRCFTARSTPQANYAPPLVGYAVYFVRPHMHYCESVQAVQDVLYLDPSMRGGAGFRLIAWCDDQLRAEGVQVVHHHVKIAHDFGKILERQGYECVERIYAKRLDITGDRVVAAILDVEREAGATGTRRDEHGILVVDR